MDIRQAILFNLNMGDFIAGAYLKDITPEEMLVRPVPGTNHLAWQLGHLILSEHQLVSAAAPGLAGELPAGFKERYTKATALEDTGFLSKEEYAALAKQVRENTLKVISTLAAEDFDRAPSGNVPPMLKSAGELLLFIGTHWTMHAGQWVVLRRKLGRPFMF